MTRALIVFSKGNVETLGGGVSCSDSCFSLSENRIVDQRLEPKMNAVNNHNRGANAPMF